MKTAYREEKHSAGRTIQTRARARCLSHSAVKASDNCTLGLPQVPHMEVIIHHKGGNHDLQSSSDETTYKYKDADGSIIHLYYGKHALGSDNEDDFAYEHQGRTVTIKKSQIKNYRQENNYYGALRVIPPKCESFPQHNDSSFHLEPINHAINHELLHYSSENDAIIPACNVGYTIISKDGKNYQIWSRALNFMKEKLGDNVQLELTNVEKSYQTADNKNGQIPITVLYIGVKNKGAKKTSQVNRKNKDAKKTLSVKKKILKKIKTKKRRERKEHKLEHSFNTNYINFAQRGNVCFNEIRKVGIRFIDELLQENYVNEDLSEFSNSLSCTAELAIAPSKSFGNSRSEFCPTLSSSPTAESALTSSNSSSSAQSELGVSLSNTSETVMATSNSSCENGFGISVVDSYIESSINSSSSQSNASLHKESTLNLFRYLCNLVKNNDFLLDFQYTMEKEKWIEIRRTFNTYQVNGESIADIVLKVSFKILQSTPTVTFYLRCLGKLVKSGLLTSKSSVENLINALGRQKFVCIGLDKEKFIYQSDENEKMRKHLKDNARLSMLPFERLLSRNCKSIVQDDRVGENFKFQRGSKTVFGPIVVCNPCLELAEQLQKLFDPSLDVGISARKDVLVPPKPRFGPAQHTQVDKRIKRLCTETAYEFVSDAQKELENERGIRLVADILSRQQNPLECNSDEEGTERDFIKEEDFDKIISVKSTPDGSTRLEKRCGKCNFETESMLELFAHAKLHLFSSKVKCNFCSLNFSTKQFLNEHQKEKHSAELLICPVCQQQSSTLEDFFYHMSSHRSNKPFVCAHCEERYQTLDSYRKHMKEMHKMGTLCDLNFKCDTCKTYFFTRDHLFIHILNYNHCNGMVLKCSLCTFACNSVSTFQKHVIEHTNEQREANNLLICSECKQFYFSGYELEDHMKKIHSLGDPPVARRTAHTQPLVLTEQNNLDGKNLCKAYETSNVLQNNLEIPHSELIAETNQPLSPSVTYSLSCNLCGMKFPSDYYLNIHLNFHSTNRPDFQSGDSGYNAYSKRTQMMDNISQNDHHKTSNLGKLQVIHQHQSQQISTGNYSHVYNAGSSVQLQNTGISFPDGQIVAVAGQSQVMQPPARSAWNQQVNSTTTANTQDSVYSLLHL